jgi:hypothetical protein
MAGATLFICINIQVNDAPCTDEIFIAFFNKSSFPLKQSNGWRLIQVNSTIE